MRGSRKFFQRGSNFDYVFFFLVDDGREDPNTTISGPSSNAGLVVLWFYSGSGPVLLGNYIFVIFQGVRTPCPPPPPSRSAHGKFDSVTRE